MKKQYSPIPEYDGFEPKKSPTSENTDQSALSKNISKSTEKRTDVQTDNVTVLQQLNITVLQSDIITLRQTADKSQTLRLTPKEVEQLRTYAFELTNKTGKRVGQGDFVRLGLMLLSKLDKTTIQTLLQTIL